MSSFGVVFLTKDGKEDVVWTKSEPDAWKLIFHLWDMGLSAHTPIIVG